MWRSDEDNELDAWNDEKERKACEEIERERREKVRKTWREGKSGEREGRRERGKLIKLTIL